MDRHDNNSPESVHTDRVDIHQLDRMDIHTGGPGGMGLKGLWALVGNSTAMVLLAIVMFTMIRQVQVMHHEGITTLKEILDHQVRGQEKCINQNTEAIRELSREIKGLHVVPK